jgi:hypothetical protein
VASKTLTAPPYEAPGTTLVARPAWVSTAGPRELRKTYICPECRHVLRVSGLGRHQVYFELDDERSDAPVIDRVCPGCGHGLLGKNARRVPS